MSHSSTHSYLLVLKMWISEIASCARRFRAPALLRSGARCPVQDDLRGRARPLVIFGCPSLKIVPGAALVSVSCPPKSPLDQLAGLAERELGSAADPAEAESVLVARLSKVPDLRRRRGLRHPLVVGGDSVTAIWQWAARASQDKLARLGARRHPWTGRFLVPSERTFRRVLGKLDADALDAALGDWAADVARGVVPAPVVAATPGPPEREQRRATQRSVEHPAPDGLLPAAAVDGKVLRGARTPEGGRVFLVAAIDHTTGAVLGQRQAGDKRGEGAAA